MVFLKPAAPWVPDECLPGKGWESGARQDETWPPSPSTKGGCMRGRIRLRPLSLGAAVALWAPVLHAESVQVFVRPGPRLGGALAIPLADAPPGALLAAAAQAQAQLAAHGPTGVQVD